MRLLPTTIAVMLVASSYAVPVKANDQWKQRH